MTKSKTQALSQGVRYRKRGPEEKTKRETHISPVKSNVWDPEKQLPECQRAFVKRLRRELSLQTPRSRRGLVSQLRDRLVEGRLRSPIFDSTVIRNTGTACDQAPLAQSS
ncbi:hypothetical protein MG293_012804 [Ovis ammon polii]|uniref:Uncharacterized protein n=1 Tax=Ovis ammon polii TaxID=230172 RepID=A0AAD4U028_OVIAM|nr:hypothetical protein MG293_012804 [Ovis ammon polii]